MADLNPVQFEHPYERHIEMVPTDVMWEHREYDRETEPRSGTDLDELTASVAERGITSPLILTYGQKDNLAYLGEGNHRLAAAKRLGMPAVPVRVNRVMRAGQGAPVKGAEPNEDGYVPADLKPSQIGLPGRPR